MSEQILDPAVIDTLRELASGDPAFLNDLFTMYLDQAHDSLRSLRTALDAGDRVRFSRAAHSLAGASLNVGAQSLGQLCQRIEIEMSRPEARPRAELLTIVEDHVRVATVELALHAVA